MKTTTIPNQSGFPEGINEEIFAAWLDGTLSPEESDTFVSSMESDATLSQLLDDYDDITETYDDMISDGYDLPEEFLEDFPYPLWEDMDDDFYDPTPSTAPYFIEGNRSSEMFDEEESPAEGMFADETEEPEYVPENVAVDSQNFDNSGDEVCMVSGEESEYTEYREWPEEDEANQDVFDDSGF